MPQLGAKQTLITSFVLILCSSMTQSRIRNLLEVISTSGLSTSRYFRLLHEGQLATFLANEGPFTLLVPTNAAFSLLNDTFLYGIRKDEVKLKAFLSGHIIPEKLLLRDVRDGTSVQTLLGDTITFSVSRRGVSIEGSFISVADIEATNGVAHVIDRVLVLEGLNGFGNTPENILDKLKIFGLNFMIELLHLARLYDVLSHTGPFTLFAPTNKAFTYLNPDFVSRLKEDYVSLRFLLLNHIVPHVLTFPAEFRSIESRSINGLSLILSSERLGYFVNGSKVSKRDLFASNGVVHVIDEVLLPPEENNIVFPPVLAERDAFSILELLQDHRLNAMFTIIKQLGLETMFTSGGPFTVFVPTDLAFRSLDENIQTMLKGDFTLLRELVLNHVVLGIVPSTALSGKWRGLSLAGDVLKSFKAGNKLFVNGSKVTRSDISAKNGVVHVVDKIILPQRNY